MQIGRLTQIHNMKKNVAFGLWIILLSTIVLAIPLPHGIDGLVYDLDGITTVGSGINFQVKDISNGQIKEGVTKNGRYSVSLNGNSGNTIVITVWNNYHASNRTIVLDGVMHNVNLILNMSMPNSAPIITSNPITQTFEDQLYLYNVIANDSNGDDLYYSLEEKPLGMSISQNGQISWLPDNNNVGDHSVFIMVSDGTVNATQKYNLTVYNVNDAPVIISGAITSAIEDQLYVYQVNASDVDSSELFYSLNVYPAGMSINSSSGLIQWLPNNDDVGAWNVSIEVSDGNLSASQMYILSVENSNDEFVINSTPITVAVEDQLYTYDVNAYDIDKDDVIVYSLLVNPSGMSINPSTGLITWIPVQEQIGNNSVIVQVTDNNTVQNQSFVIQVSEVNDAPEIHSSPVTVADVGVWYEYVINASDEENNSLTYNLLQNPSRMRITVLEGVITWKPNKKNIGVHSVSIGVSDGTSLTSQNYTLTVSDVQNLLASQSVAKPEDIEANDGLTYTYIEVNEPVLVALAIENSWLQSVGATADDLVVKQYTEKGWEETNYNFLRNDGSFVYLNTFADVGYLAVSLLQKPKLQDPRVTGPPEQYILEGRIFDSTQRISAEEGQLIQITNLDSEEIFRSQVGLQDGRYYIIAHGTIGDKLELRLGDSVVSFSLKNDEKDLNWLRKGNTLIPLPNFKDIKERQMTLSGLIIISIGLLCMMLLSRYRIK
jgi:hypothetical protein